ncbi:MAG: hypothetical protein COV44_09640 [Deltaproteobacteria bacterium CG11_big_fil_rev_8_21_14_0_20_45_16]|nr:MAG: hypothetical protein COV44_09640 [Deltaproteobacteria bacterium CG11_big_fil_rev_8_21_14_0_20_45_16]
MKNRKLYNPNQNLKILSLTILLTSAVACGNDGKSAGDRAKSMTDTAIQKSNDIKDAITGEEKTPEEVEAKLSRQAEDLTTKIAALETKQSQETMPKVREANKTRLDRVKSALSEANSQINSLKKASAAKWNAQKAVAINAIDDAREKVNSALERQEFKEDAAEKIAKIEGRIESLKVDAAKAKGDAKKEIEEQQAKLEEKYESLKNDYDEFVESSEDKWGDFKEGMEKTFSELVSTFKGLFD